MTALSGASAALGPPSPPEHAAERQRGGGDGRAPTEPLAPHAAHPRRRGRRRPGDPDHSVLGRIAGPGVAQEALDLGVELVGIDVVAQRRPLRLSGDVVVVIVVVVGHERLEAGDVVGEVLVLGHEGADARLVLGDGSRERARRCGGADHRAGGAHERLARLGRRDLGGVAGHGGPQRGGGDAGGRECVTEHADDAGRPLVRGRAQLEAIEQLVVGRRADDLGGLAVREVGEQGAEADGHRHAAALGEADHLLGEHPPSQRRLGTEQEQGVGARQAGRPHPHDRPLDVPLRRSPTGGVAVEADARAHGGEVGEPLGVDVADLGGRPVGDHVLEGARRGVAGVVPSGEGVDQHGAVQVRLAAETEVLHRSSRYRSHLRPLPRCG